MKRKLKRFWREWGLTLEDVKGLLCGVLLFLDLYLAYLFMWLLQY